MYTISHYIHAIKAAHCSWFLVSTQYSPMATYRTDRISGISYKSRIGAESLGGHDFGVDFASWLGFGLPLSLVMLILCWIVVQLVFVGFRLVLINRLYNLQRHCVNFFISSTSCKLYYLYSAIALWFFDFDIEIGHKRTYLWSHYTLFVSVCMEIIKKTLFINYFNSTCLPVVSHIIVLRPWSYWYAMHHTHRPIVI